MFGDGDGDLKCPNLRSGSFQPINPSMGQVVFLWSASAGSQPPRRGYGSNVPESVNQQFSDILHAHAGRIQEESCAADILASPLQVIGYRRSLAAGQQYP